MKTFLFDLKCAIEPQRVRVAVRRVQAIKRGNKAQVELLGDVLCHLDNALFCIDHELGYKPKWKGE